MKAKSLIISVLFVVISSFAYGQGHNEQVTVEGSYRPQIKRSERLQKMPETPDNNYNIPNYKAETKDFSYDNNMEVETMSAVAYKAEYGIEGKNNFLKAGLGTRLSPVFLFRHYSDLSKNMSLGVGVKHYSSWLNNQDYKKSSFMNNGFNVMTVNKFRGGQLRAFGDYKYDMYHLRAYDDIENPNGRNIHSLNLGAKWLSNGSSYRDFYTELGGDYRATWILNGVNENQLNAQAYLAYSDNWFSNTNINDLQTIAANVDMNLNNVFQNQLLVAVNPYFAMSGEFYHIHAGVRVDFKTGDDMGIYPDVLGSVFVLDNKLEFYAKFGGRSKINTFADIVAENPFVTTDFKNYSEFGYEKTRFDFQGGAKARIANNIDAHLGVRYRNINNSVFFIPDYDFYATYDDDAMLYHLQAFDLEFGDYNVVNILADAHWKALEKLDIALELSINNYSFPIRTLDKPGTDKAWYKPDFTLNLRGDYRLNEIWRFNASMMLMGKRWAMSPDGVAEQLKSAVDIQLGTDYQIEKYLAAYVEIHNLINDKYQLYYNYPSLGFEVFAGIKYRF